MAYLFALVLLAIGTDDGPTHAVTVRFNHPDRQLKTLIQLFDGERVADPAAALAAWRRANGNTKTLGKPAEAAIAALNPQMTREVQLLDRGEFALDFRHENGQSHWFARFPLDDVTLAGFATALALSGGASEPPLDGIEIDRLGPAGSPVMARRPADGRVVIASDRDDLAAAFATILSATDANRSSVEGIDIRVLPDLLLKSSSVGTRQAAEAILGLGVRSLAGHLQLIAGDKSSTLELVVESPFQGSDFSGSIDPLWLESVPSSAAVAFAFGVDPKPETWNAMFATLDRIQKANPRQANAAASRTRLNLLATAAGVQPEVDLWPKLRGVSGFATLPGREFTKGATAVVALHLTSEAAAKKLVEDLVPKVARFLRIGPADGGEVRSLGRVSGQPLLVVQRGSSAWIGWGETSISSALDAGSGPKNLVQIIIPTVNRTSRLVAAWPGRLGIASPGLNAAPPIIWSGETQDAKFVDRVTWTGLKQTLHDVLESLPLAPRK